MAQFVRLRLSGFKSFVDPTDLSIEPGMTGVVGPNGCGKSNLVEALKWVMGETSAKRMRGGEMDDVIFGGSANRPSRNLAEVALLLDNSDRRAPAAFNEFDQLDVVRRIEREKGSNYRINGKEVRARDVQLLFADNATGAHSTAMVSQGRVGAIINAKPADRRLLLEEAAGITGLHSRRHEAELRLRAAETNLERLDDVIGTLESQLQGLRRQARQATRYRNIAGHLRRNEAILLHLDSLAAQEALIRARDHFASAEAEVARLTEVVASASTEQAEAAADLPPLRQREAEAAAALQRLLLERDSLDRDEAQVAAAQRQANERLAQLEGDLGRAASLSQDAGEARTRLTEERTELEQAIASEGEAGQAAEAERERNAAAVAEQETAVTALAEKVAADEARGNAMERRVGELRERLSRLKDRLTETESERERLESETLDREVLDNAEQALAEAETALESSRVEVEAAEAKLQEARAEEASRRSAAQQAESERARLSAEVAGLAAILEKGQSDIWSPVVDQVSVTPGYEAALGAALGDDLDVPADEAAPVHWETLPPLVSPPALPNGSVPLSDKVTAPKALARCLSQVGVVDSPAAGARLQAELQPGQRLVTKDGALWRWDGLTAKADAPTAAAQRLEQKNRLADLRDSLPGLEKRANDVAEAHQAAQAAAEAAATAERGTREQQRAAYAEVGRQRDALGRLHQQAAAANSKLTALSEAAARIATDLEETEAELEQGTADLAALPDLASERARLSDLRGELAQRRAVLVEAEATAQRLSREAEARRERLLAIEREDTSWQRRGEETQRHMEDLKARRAQVEEELSALAERPAQIAEQRAALVERIESAENTRRAAADSLALGETRQSQADRALKTAEHDLSAAREERVRGEAAVSQAEQGLVTLEERVRERLECTVDQVLELTQLAPDQDLPGREEIEVKVQRLIREREGIGAVNLRAESEAAEVEQQIDGMQNERADLTAAIARLRQGISSLNREGRERLLAAFAQVNERFSELFVRLFGGGRAMLKLTEAEDPLDAGLEIMASPPGKRLQVMSLLSGGEQALTAIALLFAVFLVNPAPICVLDEVDAPLDDSNVDRFCSLVEELAHGLETRFLVVTHHRLTMARMDRLFGVTMSERGVSQLVSVDLEEAEALRESA